MPRNEIDEWNSTDDNSPVMVFVVAPSDLKEGEVFNAIIPGFDDRQFPVKVVSCV